MTALAPYIVLAVTLVFTWWLAERRRLLEQKADLYSSFMETIDYLHDVLERWDAALKDAQYDRVNTVQRSVRAAEISAERVPLFRDANRLIERLFLIGSDAVAKHARHLKRLLREESRRTLSGEQGVVRSEFRQKWKESREKTFELMQRDLRLLRLDTRSIWRRFRVVLRPQDYENHPHQ